MTMRAPNEATVLVTGATDGLGKRVALELAQRDATVLVHGRSRERCEAVLEEVRRGTGSEGAHYYLADLSSLGAVRGLAEQILSEHDRLDVLVNNAGVIAREREETEDGLELTFAVNYLAHFLLTNLLVPLLRDSAPARIVNVASAGQSPVDFRDVMLERGYDGMSAYTQSKLAQVMFTFELADRVGRAPPGHRGDDQRPAPCHPHGHQDGSRDFRPRLEQRAGGRRRHSAPCRLARARRGNRPLL